MGKAGQRPKLSCSSLVLRHNRLIEWNEFAGWTLDKKPWAPSYYIDREVEPATKSVVSVWAPNCR